MTYSELQPSAACRSLIKQFWSLEKRVDTGDRQTLFPDSYPEILLNLGGQIKFASGDDANALPRFVSIGIQQRKLELTLSEEVRFFSARLYPWASLGLPNLVAPSGDIRDLRTLLPEKIPSTLKGFADLIESFIGPTADAITNLVQVFYEQGDYVHVLDALDQLDLSRRTLERFFEKNVNLSVKKLLQVRRFEKALTLLYFYPRSSLAEIGLSLGYADQAHF